MVREGNTEPRQALLLLQNGRSYEAITQLVGQWVHCEEVRLRVRAGDQVELRPVPDRTLRDDQVKEIRWGQLSVGGRSTGSRAVEPTKRRRRRRPPSYQHREAWRPRKVEAVA